MSKKIVLSEDVIPARWYNVAPDLPGLEPPLNPATHKPVNPNDLAAVFPMALVEQEASLAPWIDIPEEVRQILALWRPTPLVRADGLEKATGCQAKIFFKNESVSPAGSHKTNTAAAQAYYNKAEGIKRLTTETGGGQWGTALAFAARHFDLGLTIYMVRVSYGQKPARKSAMQLYGAEVVPSPSPKTKAGRDVLAKEPECMGSLGIAISEAVEDATSDPAARYSLGSVLNHVITQQTVIGMEAKEQMARAGLGLPDVVIGCCGGGSSFGGIAFPFLRDKLDKKKDIRLVGVEPEACPSLTRGRFAYDFGDLAGLTPLLKMYTLGSAFMPPGIHAGGLRFHGMSPLVSALKHADLMEAVAVGQKKVFDAAALFAQTEGIIPAPESAHAIAIAIDEAKKPENKGKSILFNLTGHGHFDMFAYDKYQEGQIEDYQLSPELLSQGFDTLPKV